MTIEIKFEKTDDSEGEYYVSLDGRSGELVGKGDNGRVKALDRVARDKMSKEIKKKWLDTLQAAEPKCTKTFSVEIDPAEENPLTLMVDGRKFNRKSSIDDLAIVVSQIEEPTEGHRPPGL